MKGQKTGGRIKGTLNKRTLEKEAELEKVRQRILEQLGPVVDAQIEHAKGIGYLVLRNSDGTFTRATDVKQVDAALAIGAEAFKLFTQAPNPQAFLGLMGYTFGKPPERVELTGKDGEPLVIQVKKPW